jgi:hypothetical protein
MKTSLRLSMMLALGLVLSAVGCQRPSMLVVPLESRPTESIQVSGGLPLDQTIKIFVAPVEDVRPDKDRIGSNNEEAIAIPIKNGSKMPAEFVRDSFAQEFSNLGLHVVESGDATRVVKIKLQRFWAQETDKYMGSVTASISVTGALGTDVFSGVYTGTGDNFGRSLSVENYQETYTRAVQKLIENVVNDPAFQKGLR